MGTDQRYPIPAGTYRTEEEIKRSRFITTLNYTPAVEEARAFVGQVRVEFPDASHNCWAYLVGPPGSSGTVGMSDDGEPHGTAGRPMLGVLLHSGVGDVTAVVTRYFGGTKLGKGGLVRAYSGGVQAVLEKLPLADRIVYKRLSVVIDYASVTPFQRLLPECEAEVENEVYGADVEFHLKLPQERVGAFKAALVDLTNGQIIIEETE